ncbi:hypothetical protein BDN72DRAFT_577374 [Pluteus cervinus]|uniref:Uncharacterized protein n=1 Tax=Pluteus cervinus TaxID=181527 RepID=A0ACD3AW47_9AGAR|nr:hypothetical protein BDN72DRAFT_577374 [Pluteus cervinus]
MERSDLWGGIIEPSNYRISPWSQASLIRSGSSKLDVSYERVSLNDPRCRFTISVLGELSRVRSLNISPPKSHTNTDNIQKIARCLEQPAPQLEELSFGSNENGMRFSHFLSTFRLFNGNAPVFVSIISIQRQVQLRG